MTLILPANSLSISPNFHFIERGLIVTGQPTVEEWGETLQTIQMFDEDMLPFIIGDMLNYGELTYDQADSQFLKYNGEGRYTRASLRNLKYICSRWPVSRRRYELPFSFYQETAGLSPDQQDRVMQDIVDNGGKRNGLRAEVRQLNNGKERNPPTNPQDRIEELEQENRAKDKRISELESTAPIISFTLTEPPDLPAYVTRAIGDIQNYLCCDGGDNLGSVTITKDGETWNK